MFFKGLIVSSLVLLYGITAFGQESRKEFCVEFPVGSSKLDTSYGDNAARLSEVESFLEGIQNDSTCELVEVIFCGYASPEGGYARNIELAGGRTESLEHYVRERVSLPDSIVTIAEGVIAWEPLAILAEASDMPHREEALNVLRNVPVFTYDSKGVLVDSRKKQLMDLQYGRTWHYMYDHFFCHVRSAVAIFVTIHKIEELPKEPEVVVDEPLEPPVDTTVFVESGDTSVVEPVDTSAVEQITEAAETLEIRKPFYMAIKTNMLYDVAAIPNIGVEFYLGKRWSIGGDWMYGWWNKDSKHKYWRFYGGELAVRKWFGKKAEEKPLQGHHLGLYGQMFTYDFEWKGKGYMGGEPGGTLWDEMNYAAGVEYGYSLPIAKRLNIDFAVGVGYWGGKYYEYIPLDGHYVWQSTNRRNWIGPTKAEVTLVWLLGRGNTNPKKGGAR